MAVKAAASKILGLLRSSVISMLYRKIVVRRGKIWHWNLVTGGRRSVKVGLLLYWEWRGVL